MSDKDVYAKIETLESLVVHWEERIKEIEGELELLRKKT